MWQIVITHNLFIRNKCKYTKETSRKTRKRIFQLSFWSRILYRAV